MKEYNVVTLEDGNEYIEIDKINDNGYTYLVLSNSNNPNDFCIRKLVVEEGKEYIIGLNGDEEFDRIYEIFSKKYI